MELKTDQTCDVQNQLIDDCTSFEHNINKSVKYFRLFTSLVLQDKIYGVENKYKSTLTNGFLQTFKTFLVYTEVQSKQI